MLPGLILLILFFSFVLIKSADLVIVAIRRLSKETQAGVFTISAVILALSTSLPEMFVGIASALENSSNLAYGVVFGSNIANIALVGGITALLAGKIWIRSPDIIHDVWIAFAAGILPVFLALDKSLSRVDGLILLAVYGAYATGFFRKRYQQIADEQEEEEGFIYRFTRQFNHVASRRRKEFGRLFVGVALLLFSADIIVRISVELATQANIPLFLVGLFAVAIGSSLPELAFSIRSIADDEPTMFLGNLLGSTIANSTLVIGIVTLVQPLEVVAFNEYITAIITFILVFIVFLSFIKSKHRLDRKEAVLMLLIYLVFGIVEFVQVF